MLRFTFDRAEPPALAAPPVAGTPATQSRKVLVVEDNADAADSVQMLPEMLGHEVRVARAGTEGVALAGEWRPDVMLSDIGLPGSDGFGVAQALKPSGVRFVAITAYGDEEVARRARASGFERLLVKPADPLELARLLEEFR
jgi:CheY-like chemotaxis protein